MIKIGSTTIQENQAPFVIAEIGKNFIQTKEDQPWQEYLDNAKALVLAAKEAGADAVKFQTHIFEDEQMNVDVVSPHFKGADRYSWVKRNTEATPIEFWQQLKSFCDEQGIIFFSTPMSRKAAMMLESINVPLWKVGSGDILDFVTLDYITKTKKPIIISSGMSTLEELDLSLDFLKTRQADIVLMHCVSKYPCPPEELNLQTISFLQKRFQVLVGFSDHSLGHDSVLAAVQLGAVVIEKHFSFDRTLFGADHKVSMTPAEFKAMVDDIKAGKKSTIENYGKEIKMLQEDESVFRPYFRKALVAGRDIKAGEILKAEDIYAMRPGGYIDGLPSEQFEKILGMKVIKDLKKYDPIKLEFLQ